MRKMFHLYNVDDEKVLSCTREISRDMLLNFDQSEVMGKLKADVVGELIKSMLYQIAAGKTYLIKLVDAETEDFMSNAKVYQATLGFMEVEEVKDNEPERRKIECPYDIRELLSGDCDQG